MVEFCVVLSGGKSSRMHTNKALLPFCNYNLITYQFIKLSKIFKKVFISLKDSQKNIIFNAVNNDLVNYNSKNPPLKFDLSNLIIEENDIFTPLIGILNSFNVINAEKMFFISCDCPLVSLKTIQILIRNSKFYDVTYAKDSNKHHPLVGVWSIETEKIINSAILSKKFKIMYLLECFITKSIFFDKFEFLNLNTKSEYQLALKSLE